jgi:lipopolysaccharide/colanic/teichoic acid biosynthesis glycosyltransferase
MSQFECKFEVQREPSAYFAEFKHLTQPASAYQRWGKRLFDICFSVPALLVVSPILILCAAAVRIDSRGPILFRHKRVGRYGMPLTVIKFRTMSHDPVRKASNLTVAGDPRITRVGKYLRRSKLDELPQFFNVLAGQMSIVGPRPEVAEHVSLYTSEQTQVLSLKPGITGAASVIYNNEEAELRKQSSPHEYYVRVLMPRKLELDLLYARRMSLRTDLSLVVATLRKMLNG